MILVGAEGFELCAKKLQVTEYQGYSQSSKSDYTQIRAHEAGASCPDLAKVVAGWQKLPAPLKAAILAIINSAEGVQ